MQRWILSLLLVAVFLLENVFSFSFPADFLWKGSIAVPHFLIIVLFFIAIYYHSLQAVYFSLLFGFLFDVVNTELIGIYLFLYPVLTYLVINAMRILQVNVFIVSVLVLVGVTALEYAVYGLLLLLGQVDLTPGIFFEKRILATLVLNGIFLLLFCVPLKKYFLRLAEAREEK